MAIIEYAFEIKVPNRIERLLVLPVLFYRLLRYGYAFRLIPLTRGKFAIVDPDDYYRLSIHKWHAYPNGRTFYAARRATINGVGKRYLPMHRAVLKAPKQMFVDHINRNGLDNRKANLRLATHAQNSCNRAKRSNRKYSSAYKGVTFRPERNLYRVQIRVRGNPISLGSFRDELAAAKAYDRAAKKYHGQFASLNFQQPKRLPLHCIINVYRSLHNYLAYLSSRSRTQFGGMCNAHRKPVDMTPLSGELFTSLQSGIEKSWYFASRSRFLQFFKNFCHHF